MLWPPKSSIITPAGLTTAALLLALPASASSPSLDEDSGTPVFSLEDDIHGDEKGKVQHAGAPKVIYLNFDGVTLTSGTDDAPSNRSGICAGSFPPYGEGAKKAAVLQMVQTHWEALNVQLVTERPAQGPYTMAVISPYNCIGGGGGVAFVNCDDSNPNNVVFAFIGADDQWPVEFHAAAISQEIGHAYGLDHTVGNADIMNPMPTGGIQAFSKSCLPITGGSCCPKQHAQHCDGDPNQQNSFAELVTIVGEREPDLGEPTVHIVSPENGAWFEPGEVVEISVSAQDDVGVSAVLLMVDGVDVGSPDTEPPYDWSLEFENGSHELVAVAVDNAGNAAISSPVMIFVGDDAGNTGSDGTDSSGWMTSGGAEDGTSAGPHPPGPMQVDRSSEGCACVIRNASPSAPWLVALLLTIAARRRPGT